MTTLTREQAEALLASCEAALERDQAALAAAQEELRKAREDYGHMQQCFEDARSQWIECRDKLRVLHDQSPVAWMNGDRAKTNEQIQDIADYGYLLKQNGWTPLYAAPVPAILSEAPEGMAMVPVVPSAHVIRVIATAICNGDSSVDIYRRVIAAAKVKP